MAKSSNVTINILANGSKAQQQFRDVGAAASAMGEQIKGSTSGIRGHLDAMSTKLKDVGESMMSVGKQMTTMVTLPVVAGMGLAVKAASDLNETLSKTSVIFGSGAMNGLTKWATDAATSMGLSKRAALDSAATFGVMAKNAGLASKDVENFSLKMTGLSSDLASFFNAKPEEAVIALGAAFRGESEPIRRFGVSLSVATIQARALSEGIVKAEVDTLKLSTAQEAVEKSTRKAADAIKKHGVDSVQAKDAVRDQEQAEARLATVLQGKVPILTAEQKLLATRAEIMAQTSAAQGDFARTADGVANSQRTAAAEAENAAASFGTVLLPAYNALLGVARDVMHWFDQLTESQKRWIAIGAVVLAVAGPLLSVFGAIATAVGAIGLPVLAVVAALAALAAAAVYAYQHFEGFRRVVDSVMSWLTTNVPAALTAVRNFFRDALDEIRAFWDRWGDDIERAASTALAGVKTVVGPVMNGIAATIKTTLAILKGDWRGAWDGIKAVAESGIKGAAAAIRLNASLMWEAAQQIMRAFKNGVLAIWTEVQAWFAGLGGKIKSAIGAAKDMLYSIGADIVQGLINGIKSKGSAVTTAIAGVVNPLAGAAKLILDSRSPSKVFHKIGEDISVGTANGITAKKQEAVDAAKKLAEESARAAADAVSSVMGAVSSSRGLESAQRELGNAEEDLAVVRARAATIADRIAAAERALAEAKAEAAKITAEEQVAIEQATEAYEKASEAYKKGEISAAELEVAEHKLAKAKSDAVGDTDDVRAAESRLKDLRDEEKRLTKDLTDAELRRRDAQDRLIDAQIRAYDSTQKLTGNGSTLLAMFMQLASQMGLTQAQIDAVTAAINNMPSGKTITITTVYQTQGTPANTGTGGNTGSTGQHDTVDMPGHHTPVSGHAAAMQVNVNLDSKVLATAMVSTLRTQGVVRPDGTLKVTH